MTLIAHFSRTLPMAAGALLFLALAHGPAQADSAKAWVLESQSGQVHLIRSGISPISLTDGDVFSGGDWIETGPDGRAVLRRGDETIVVAPGSRIGLPKENTGRFATRILQSLGTILLTVEKQAKQHFEVQTPFLTAVVKGTTFTVGIQGEQAVVHVVEGLVEVQNLASGRSSLVRPGQTGSVLRNGPAEVDVQGAANGGQAADGQAPGVSVPNATQAAATATEKAGAGRNAKAIAITEALGDKPLNLKGSTRGLVRAAAVAAPQAALGRGASEHANGGQGQLTAFGQVVSANPPVLGGGLALGQSVSASASTGGGPALGQTASANANVGGGNNLTLGLELNGNQGQGNGAANGLGQVASAIPVNLPVPEVGNGNGLGLGSSSNPGVGSGVNLGVGGGQGNGKGQGNEK